MHGVPSSRLLVNCYFKVKKLLHGVKIKQPVDDLTNIYENLFKFLNLH